MLRKWEANDPDVRTLWSTMNGWVYAGFNATYARMGVEFDKLYYESQTYVLGKEDVLQGLKRGVFYEKDGAVWVDNTKEGLDEKVLLRRDGTVVDADDLIEEVVQEARTYGEQLSKLDEFSEAERSQLFEMIGLAALKYFILKVDAKKRMLFDPAASIDLQGHTGPFIQYTHARIKSLLRKAGSKETWAHEHRGTWNLLPEERAVIKLLHQLPASLDEAAVRLDPSSLANHTYELVKAYNGFYQTVPVLKEEDAAKREFRLALSAAVASATKKAMWCLGIEVPERM